MAQFSFVVLGTSALTAIFARVLCESGHAAAAIVALPRSQAPTASIDLRTSATETGADYREYADINDSEAVAYLRRFAPDYILSTWPRKIGREVLAVPRYCVIGTHPTYLPANRGRHPLHWAIVLGLRHTAMSFFRMNEQFDRGPVIHRQAFALEDTDTINDANKKMNDAAEQGLRDLLPRLSLDPHLGEDQAATAAGNYWRARTVHDVTIDPRLPAKSIIAIVRSFCPPYPGAQVIAGELEIRIAAARLLSACPPEQPGSGRAEYGRLSQLSATEFTLTCGDGCTVLLTAIEPITAPLPQVLHPPTFYTEQNLAAEPRQADR